MPLQSFPFWRAYPWKQQLICLLPLCVVLTGIFFCLGSGDVLTRRCMTLCAQYPDVTAAMRFLTDATLWLLYGGFALLLIQALLTRNKKMTGRVLIFSLAQCIMTVLCVQALKIITGCPRPIPALDGAQCTPFSLDGAYKTFPSGHTAEASGAASTLTSWTRRPLFSLGLGLLLALAGFSRIFLSMHHLSDVLAGACFGLSASYLTFSFCSRESS